MTTAFAAGAFQNNAFQIAVVTPVQTGTILMPGGTFSRKRWKQLLEEIRLELVAEQASLKVAKQQDEPIDYAARANRVAAIHDRALALEADAAAQSLTTRAESAARLVGHVAQVEAAYQTARALQIAIEEDEDDVMLLALAA